MVVDWHADSRLAVAFAEDVIVFVGGAAMSDPIAGEADRRDMPGNQSERA
jgi:hypothetical protein